MKKLLLFGLMLTSVGAIAQTKKVIIEDYTGVRCGFCVDGTYRIEQLEAANPTNLIPIAIHTSTNYTHANSPLRTVEGDAINSMVQPGGYPAGSVDRKIYGPSGSTGIAMNRGYWSNAFNDRAALGGMASISIENVVRNNATEYEFDVNVQFTSAPQSGVPLKLQVYILEDGIEAAVHSTANAADDLRQVSYTTQYGGNGSTSNPVFITSVDNSYYHNNVLRIAPGGPWGYNAFPSGGPALSTTYTQHVTFNSATGASPAGWVNDNLKIVAFVAYDGTAANDEKSIINAEEYSLAGVYPTSVNNVASNVEILSAYPNPAPVNSLVKVQYNMVESGNVKMNVYSLVGQLVAQPYSSTEVKGGHTIHWNPATDNLTPGVYLIEVSTANGKQIQKITLQ